MHKPTWNHLRLIINLPPGNVSHNCLPQGSLHLLLVCCSSHSWGIRIVVYFPNIASVCLLFLKFPFLKRLVFWSCIFHGSESTDFSKVVFTSGDRKCDLFISLWFVVSVLWRRFKSVPCKQIEINISVSIYKKSILQCIYYAWTYINRIPGLHYLLKSSSVCLMETCQPLFIVQMKFFLSVHKPMNNLGPVELKPNYVYELTPEEKKVRKVSWCSARDTDRNSRMLTRLYTNRQEFQSGGSICTVGPRLSNITRV